MWLIKISDDSKRFWPPIFSTIRHHRQDGPLSIYQIRLWFVFLEISKISILNHRQISWKKLNRSLTTSKTKSTVIMINLKPNWRMSMHFLKRQNQVDRLVIFYRSFYRWFMKDMLKCFFRMLKIFWIKQLISTSRLKTWLKMLKLQSNKDPMKKNKKQLLQNVKRYWKILQKLINTRFFGFRIFFIGDKFF